MATHFPFPTFLKTPLSVGIMTCVATLSIANLPTAFANTSSPSATEINALADETTKKELEDLSKQLLVEKTEIEKPEIEKNGAGEKSQPLSAPPALSSTAKTVNTEIDPLTNPNAIITRNINGQSLTLPAGILDKLSKANISPSSVSLIVQPLTQEKQSKPLFSLFPDTHRTPASTQKLIPTFIALDKLGADFRWITRIYQRGWLMNGTLHGDVVIEASGDPKLNHEALRALLGALQAKGIRHIDGNIIVGNSIFQNVNFDPSAFDKQGLRAYNAPPNGFLINFGTLQVDFIPSGKLPLVADNPVTVANSVTVATVIPTTSTQVLATPQASDSQDTDDKAVTAFIPNPDAKEVAVRLYPPLADYQYPKTLPASPAPCVRAKIPRPSVTTDTLSYSEPVVASCGGQTSWFTFPDSDSLIKKAVKGTWQTFDPTFKGEVIIQNTPTDKAKASLWYSSPFDLPLVSHASAPLSEQIWDINHYSNNVMTEQVALSLPLYADKKADTKADTKQTSDYPTTFKFINTWWQKNLPRATPPVMTRASGLCRDCQVTPESMLALLNYAYHGKNFETFKESMGVAGVSGTMKPLKKRHPDSPAIGRAWIKTGTLDNVTSIAGYVKGNSGKWYAVVGMINAPNVGHNDNVKAVLDEMLAWTAVQ